jgi:RNA polymerase sigma-70 factor (ECF subfamily)
VTVPDPSADVSGGDLALARRIVAGDEAAFVGLVRRHHAGFLRLAAVWAKDAAVAEEVVQETWLIALERLGEFAGRSALKTWLCGILVNTARSRARSERRHGTAGLAADELDAGPDEPAVPAHRFSPPGDRWDGHWALPPAPWPSPEKAFDRAESRALLTSCLETLPPAQRAVLLLRDVEQLSAEEACNALGLSSTHQRVLLHRARSRMRALLERHHETTKGVPS